MTKETKEVSLNREIKSVENIIETYDEYNILEENRESINNDYNKIVGSWDIEYSDETLLEFIKTDNYWKKQMKER